MNEEEFEQFLTAIERELSGEGGDFGSAMAVITASVNALKGHPLASIAISHFKSLEAIVFPDEEVPVAQEHPKRKLPSEVHAANFMPRPYSFRDVHHPPEWYRQSQVWMRVHVLLGFMEAVEGAVVKQTDTELKRTLKLARKHRKDDEVVGLGLPCILKCDMDILIPIIESELAYRRSVN